MSEFDSFKIAACIEDCRITRRRNSHWIKSDGGAIQITIAFVDQSLLDAAEAAKLERLAKPFDAEPSEVSATR